MDQTNIAKGYELEKQKYLEEYSDQFFNSQVVSGVSVNSQKS